MSGAGGSLAGDRTERAPGKGTRHGRRQDTGASGEGRPGGGGHPGRGPGDRGGTRRGRGHRLRDRAQHPRTTLGVQPARDHRGHRGPGHRRGRPGHRGAHRPPGVRPGPRPGAAHRRGAGAARRPGQRHLGRRTALRVGRSRVEHNLDNGLRMLRLGVDTHAITSHHALPLLLRRPGGLVVEVTDGTAEYNGAHYRSSFFYDLVKTAVLRMAFALSREVGPRGATSVALTPGWLRSELMLDIYGVTEENWRDALEREPHFCISETPRYVGRAVAALAADPDVARWNGASLSSGQLAQVYGFTDLDGSRPDSWRYLVEVQDAGKPADPTGYR